MKQISTGWNLPTPKSGHNKHDDVERRVDIQWNFCFFSHDDVKQNSHWISFITHHSSCPVCSRHMFVSGGALGRPPPPAMVSHNAPSQRSQTVADGYVNIQQPVPKYSRNRSNRAAHCYRRFLHLFVTSRVLSWVSRHCDILVIFFLFSISRLLVATASPRCSVVPVHISVSRVLTRSRGSRRRWVLIMCRRSSHAPGASPGIPSKIFHPDNNCARYVHRVLYLFFASVYSRGFLVLESTRRIRSIEKILDDSLHQIEITAEYNVLSHVLSHLFKSEVFVFRQYFRRVWKTWILCKYVVYVRVQLKRNFRYDSVGYVFFMFGYFSSLLHCSVKKRDYLRKNTVRIRKFNTNMRKIQSKRIFMPNNILYEFLQFEVQINWNRFEFLRWYYLQLWKLYWNW